MIAVCLRYLKVILPICEKKSINRINLCFRNYQKLISLGQIFLSVRNKVDLSRSSASINQFNALSPLFFLMQFLLSGVWAVDKHLLVLMLMSWCSLKLGRTSISPSFWRACTRCCPALPYLQSQWSKAEPFAK